MFDREKIKNRFGGRCAYCGCIVDNRFHVDHVKARYHGGSDDTENLFPSCPSCNLWKKTFTIEEFRHEIEMQVARLRKHSAQFRFAERFGLIQAQASKVVFFFEQYNPSGDLEP